MPRSWEKFVRTGKFTFSCQRLVSPHQPWWGPRTFPQSAHASGSGSKVASPLFVPRLQTAQRLSPNTHAKHQGFVQANQQGRFSLNTNTKFECFSKIEVLGPLVIGLAAVPCTKSQNILQQWPTILKSLNFKNLGCHLLQIYDHHWSASTRKIILKGGKNEERENSCTSPKKKKKNKNQTHFIFITFWTYHLTWFRYLSWDNSRN